MKYVCFFADDLCQILSVCELDADDVEYSDELYIIVILVRIQMWLHIRSADLCPK